MLNDYWGPLSVNWFIALICTIALIYVSWSYLRGLMDECDSEYAQYVAKQQAEELNRQVADAHSRYLEAQLMSDWKLEMPFWIDTDGYTDRDREMFCCGYEFRQIHSQAVLGLEVKRPIHRDNESRVRMMCGKLGRKCEITPHEGYEGCEAWSDLHIHAEG